MPIDEVLYLLNGHARTPPKGQADTGFDELILGDAFQRYVSLLTPVEAKRLFLRMMQHIKSNCAGKVDLQFPADDRPCVRYRGQLIELSILMTKAAAGGLRCMTESQYRAIKASIESIEAQKGTLHA